MILRCFFLILGVSVQGFAKSVFVSSTAGLYQDKVVTTREAEIAHQIDLILNPKAKPNKPLQEKVSDLLLQKIVYLETENFSLQAPQSEFNQKRIKVIDDLKKQKSWQSLDVQTKEFESSLKERIFAQEFIRFKSDSFQAVVTEDQVRNYFANHKDQFSGLNLDPFKENIRTFLAQQGRDDKMREWFESLRKKYKVKNLLQPEKTVL